MVPCCFVQALFLTMLFRSWSALASIFIQRDGVLSLIDASHMSVILAEAGLHGKQMALFTPLSGIIH